MEGVRKHHTLFDTNCTIGDRLMNPDLVESNEGFIMPMEWVTVTKVTDYFIEVISDRFVTMKFARV